MSRSPTKRGVMEKDDCYIYNTHKGTLLLVGHTHTLMVSYLLPPWTSFYGMEKLIQSESCVVTVIQALIRRVRSVLSNSTGW